MAKNQLDRSVQALRADGVASLHFTLSLPQTFHSIVLKDSRYSEGKIAVSV